MSCNGCRVLRKGCSESCILRPCLQWIESAQAQANATVFVAKFFGRAGLMSFISAVPETQRPGTLQLTLCNTFFNFSLFFLLNLYPDIFDLMRSSLFLQRSFSRFYLKRVAVRSTRSTERSDCFGPGTGTCARRRSRPSSAAARFVRWLRSRRRTQTTHRRRIRAAAGRDSVAASMTWRNRIRSISISA